MPNTDTQTQSDTAPKKQIVCPRYEVFYEYLRIHNRPLTALEQRAFLYMLDLDENERFVHADEPDCVCVDLMPTIVQALKPDPVECIVAERTLEGASYPAQRYHAERVGRNQGIVLGLKTKKQHTNDLRKLARKQLDDLDTIMRELVDRSKAEYPNARAMIAKDLPKFLELAKMAQARKRPQKASGALTLARARDLLDKNHLQGAAELRELERTLARWGIGQAA